MPVATTPASSIEDLLNADGLLLPIDLAARRMAREGVEPGILSAIAMGLAGTVSSESLDFESGNRRRYVRLLQTAQYDAWLIEWAPSSDLDLHDHGGSAGAFHVVSGWLVEDSTDLIDRKPLEAVQLCAGATRPVEPTRVHRVWNPGPGDALSVHVYSPPLTSMNFYDDRPDAFLRLLSTEPVRENAPEAGV